MLSRLIFLLIGGGGLVEASLVSLVISKNPVASDTLTLICLIMIGAQLIFSVGLLAAGTWREARRWIGGQV